jgi:hypothetical protein
MAPIGGIVVLAAATVSSAVSGHLKTEQREAYPTGSSDRADDCRQRENRFYNFDPPHLTSPQFQCGRIFSQPLFM